MLNKPLILSTENLIQKEVIMKLKANWFALPATLIMVLLVFLLLIVSGNTNLSYAASASKKAPAMERKTAAEYTEIQIKQLEGALNFTDSQKPLWNDVTKVMRENAKETDARHEARAKARAERIEKNIKRSAVERIKAHTENTEAYLAQMKKLLPPFEALYNSMSDQQKIITDLLFETGKYGRHGRQSKRGRR
jgi:hypothetical protein